MCRWLPLLTAVLAACSTPVPGTTKDTIPSDLDVADADADADSDSDSDADSDADADPETAETGTPPSGSGG